MSDEIDNNRENHIYYKDIIGMIIYGFLNIIPLRQIQIGVKGIKMESIQEGG
jgi:hypothetical protein